MLIHGILAFHDTFDHILDNMKEISQSIFLKSSKKISWNKTKVYDNSNRGQSIYKGRWR